jgi:uncharacterized membrane protein
MNRRVSAWLSVLLGVGAVLTIFGLILRAIVEVLHHRGAETYLNAKGMQVHWVDVLTMWAAALLVFLVILIATAVFNWRRKRDLALVRELEARTSTESPVRDK